METIARTGGIGDDTDEVIATVPDGDWNGAWATAGDAAATAWSDPSLLARSIELPWATMPGAAVLGMYVSEVTVHTWDLASATNQSVIFDDAIVGASLDGMGQVLPAEYRGDGIPFSEVVAVAADAPLIDRLVAWTGRRP